MIKDSIKLALIFLLMLTLFINKRKVTRERYNTIAVLVMSLFLLTCVYDLLISFLIISIGYILFSKINVKEPFNDEKKKMSTEKDEKKDVEKKDVEKKDVEKKEVVVKKNAEKDAEKDAEKNDLLPTHCSKINNLDDEFLKEYDIDKKKLSDIQNNIFDKYNYDVFYNEQGEGASDIQGIFNHEVIGYEKL